MVAPSIYPEGREITQLLVSLEIGEASYLSDQSIDAIIHYCRRLVDPNPVIRRLAHIGLSPSAGDIRVRNLLISLRGFGFGNTLDELKLRSDSHSQSAASA